MERTAWTDEESSSSWEDAEFESLLGVERDEGADAGNAEGGSEHESLSGHGEEAPAEDSSYPECEQILEKNLPVLRRRKPATWKAVPLSRPPTGEPVSPIGQGSGVMPGGSPNVGSTSALVLEEDAREKAKQGEDIGVGFGYGSGVTLDSDGPEEILQSFPGTAGDEIEVEETESQARGSIASFSFQGSPQAGSGSEASSRPARMESLWPRGIQLDEEDAPVWKRTRPEGEVPEAEISEFLDDEGVGDKESTGSSEICPFKEVYRLPETDFVPLANGDPQGQLPKWPAAFVIEAIGFQFRLIGKVLSVFLWVLNFFCFMVWKPVEKTLEAKDLATGTFNQGVSYVSRIPSEIKQTAKIAGPKVGKLWNKMGLGCLAATYVVIMLISLLVPAIVMDYAVMSRFVEEPIELREVLHFDYTQSRPSAVVNLLPPALMSKARTFAASHPDKIVRIRAIPKSHKFDVIVSLTLPESDYNRKLGMFQISVELLSVRPHVLARSSRPCMLQFRSSPVRYAKTLLLGLPLLMGLSQEYQSLTVRVMENQEERVVPTATVKVFLEPKAGFPEGHGLPELYSAEIHIKSKLPWIRALIYAWRWTLYVWSAFWLFMLEVTIMLLCCRQALVPTSWRAWSGDTSDVHRSVHRSPRGRKLSCSTGKKPCKVKRRVSFQDEILTGDVVPSTKSNTAKLVCGKLSPEFRDQPSPSGLNLPHLEGLSQAGALGLRNAVRRFDGGTLEAVVVGVDKTSAAGVSRR